MLAWKIKEEFFDKEKVVMNGSKYLLGNGYMGYRGTLEEYSKKELVSCVLSGVYDKVGNGWREPVNAPNIFMTKVYCNQQPINAISCEPLKHEQMLDIKNAVHSRNSTFKSNDGILVEISSERFLSAHELHVMVMKYTVKCNEDCSITIETGIDGDVWDINGPHLKEIIPSEKDGVIANKAITNELGLVVAVAESIHMDFSTHQVKKEETAVSRNITFDAKAGVEYTFIKYGAVYTGKDDVEDVLQAAMDESKKAAGVGFDTLLNDHKEVWSQRWHAADIVIEGDEEAQLALRYSIYHLLAVAPFHTDKASIPARGLSGQVYKGGVFWDTEMFMIPFFIYSNPEAARNLLKYRCNTLDGARRKAKEYGYKGAFYAWESQDSGDDACTLFNVTDVFTNRPMRTYFRDRQIHISADVAYGIWQYYLLTGDETLLLDGGAEVILECARFYFSYAYFKKDKNRYEILQVVGPDEYHERVDNNTFTNKIVKFTLQAARAVLELLKNKYPEAYSSLISKLHFEQDIEQLIEMNVLLYIPEPDSENLIIEQFDGYRKLEDVSLEKLKERILIPNEYLGGINGLATTTRILKQADVLMMLTVFKNQYSDAVKKANWEFYEPRTEHGSSLSHCAYAIIAADLGNTDWAYKYFMKTATIDLSGQSKQYLGSLFIGGTHPAANGGAWMTAIQGFAGIDSKGDTLYINPRLPDKWTRMAFRLKWMGYDLLVEIVKDQVNVVVENMGRAPCKININGLVKELRV